MAQLTSEEYWEWKASIAEKHKCGYEKKAIEFQAEVMRLSWQLFIKTSLAGVNEKIQNSNSEYESIKAKIEERLDLSLNGKAIDEYSLEVIDLPE